jgi:hypothetical protein
MLMHIERSIDIALSEQPPEPFTAEAILVPLSSTESLIAVHGLGGYIDMLYGAVRKDSNDQRALESVHELISENIEDYRIRAKNLETALNPERAIHISRELAALSITYLMVGQKAHRTGVWLKGTAREVQLVEGFKEVMESDDLTFIERNDWAIRQTILNDRFWRQQLQSVRTHPRIIELREAIDESDHNLIEV